MWISIAGAERPWRTPDFLRGAWLLGVVFVLSLGLSRFSRHLTEPEYSGPPPPPTTAGLQGWPSQVDPVRSIAAVRRLSRRPELRGLVLDAVGRDGLFAPGQANAGARYVFQSMSGMGPQPRLDGDQLRRSSFCGLQVVRLRYEGLVAEPDRPYTHCAKAMVEPLPDPVCGPRELWNEALLRAAPTDRALRFEYYRSRVGPAWRVSVPSTRFQFEVYGDCHTELSQTDGYGRVP